MSSGQHLRMLTGYSAWASSLLYESLRTVPEAALSSARPGRPDGIVGVVGHIYVVSLIWKAHLMGQDHGFKTRRLNVSLTLTELHRRQSDVDRWYVEFSESQTAESLAKNIRFTFVDGGAGTMRVDEMVLHVVNHSTYHRGYVADMLYELGSTPPTMDLPVYIRGVRAAESARA